MPNTLLLIRHSQSQQDSGSPASQWPLTEAGRRRCIALAERLVAYTPDMIVTSRERKASETGALVAARLGLPTMVTDGLHEHQREHVGWLSNAAFEQAVSAFFTQPHDLVFGEETANQASARFDAAVGGVIAAHPGRTAVIVAHGIVITLFLAQHAGVAALPFWKRLGMPAIVVLSLPELGLLEVIEQIGNTTVEFRAFHRCPTPTPYPLPPQPGTLSPPPPSFTHEANNAGATTRRIWSLRRQSDDTAN